MNRSLLGAKWVIVWGPKDYRLDSGLWVGRGEGIRLGPSVG